MSTQLIRRKGNKVQHDAFVGANAEITVLMNEDGKASELRLHDGETLGGLPISGSTQFVTLEQFDASAGTGGDDTAAFEAACAESASTGKTVLLLDKTYSIEPQPWNNGVPHYTVASIDGVGNPVLKARSRKPAVPAVWAMLSVAFSKKGGSLKNFTVDPDLSDDPVEWTSENYDSAWEGSRAIYIEKQKDFTLENVHTLSSIRAGIAILDCDNFVLARCTTKRSRNTFGDGIYMTGRNFAVMRCDVYDCTRIGIVVETVVGDKLSSNFIIENCTAEFCHDNDVAYGGSNINAGFWYENFAHGVTINCTAKDAGERGFTTAHSIPSVSHAFYEDEMVFTSKYISCRVDGSINGFTNSNLSSSIVKSSVVLEQCTAKNVTRFVSTAKGEENRAFFAAKNCHAVIPSTSSTATGFMHLGGELVIENCTLRFDNFDEAAWDDVESNYGAVSLFSTDAGHSLKIDNLKVFTSVEDEIPAMLKQKSVTSRERLEVEVKNTWLLQKDMRVKTARFENVIFEKIGTTLADECYYSHCTMMGVYGTGLARFPVYGIDNGVTKLDNCTFDFRASGDYLYLWNESKIDAAPVVTVSNCTFIKDVAVDGYMVRLNAKTEMKAVNGVNNFEINNCTFTNTGGVTSNPIVDADMSVEANPAILLGSGNVKSETLSTNVSVFVIQNCEIKPVNATVAEPVAITASRNVALSDINREVANSTETAVVLTLLAGTNGALPIGTELTLTKLGTGNISFTPTSPTTINGTTTFAVTTQYSSRKIRKVAAGAWVTV